MVNEIVSIKKPFNWPKLFLIIGLLVLVLGILYVSFFLGSVFGDKPNIEITLDNPVMELLSRYEQQGVNITQEKIIEQAENEFDINYINYALYAMSAYKLHNPPLSKDTPKIRMVFEDGDIYYSEVINGEVFTYEQKIGESDIIVTSTKKEIINAMLVDDMSEFMGESVSKGNTNIEMIAGTLKLASKGYLQMYEDVTGESFA